MLASLLGAALALTMPPFGLGWLAPLPLALLLTRFRGPRRAREAFWAGVGYWAVLLAWLPWSFAEMFGPLGALPFVPMILAEAAFWAVLVALFGSRGLALVGAWWFLDRLRAHLGVLAFPWGDFGYALVDAPGRWLAALGGVGLLSLVVLLVAYALARGRYAVLLAWALLWFVPLPQTAPDRQALLVQGAVDPLGKVRGESAEARYLELTRAGLARHPEADLVVWPETAVARLPRGLEEVLGGRDLLTGLAAYDGGYRNRVVWWREGEVLGHYDKTRLVPFGEFFPWRGALGWLYDYFFDAFGLGPLADTVPGGRAEPLGPYGVYICYESAFPGVARTLVRAGARVLVNVSNDAWFGPSFGGAQHFAMGRLRAVETGRWLLRAGNDGVTAAIDPYGRVAARLPAGEPGYLAAPYALEGGATPYVRWGDLPVALLAGGLVVWGWTRRRRGLPFAQF